MSWNARRAAIVLLPLIVAVSAVCLDQGRAQVKMAAPLRPAGAPLAPSSGNMDPDGFLKNGIHLLKDEKGRGKQIEAAIDYINDENWATAVERLQKLLEIDEDVFVRLKRKNADGGESYVWVSAKQEADRLLSTLPPAGMDFYKATYGAKAAEMLKKAKKNGDPGLLNDIMKRYAHTDAGAEAIKLLGDYKFDRGEYMPALLCYSKLINRLGADKTPLPLLAKAAWAAHLAPPSSSDKNTVTAANVLSEKELWRMLRGRTREVQLGEQAIAVDDLQEHVAKLDRSRLEQNATDSLIYRATPSRSNQLTGGPAFMTREWGVSLLYESEKADGVSAARTHIRSAKNALKGQNQPIIPAFSPIALSVLNGKGERIPLLIYKNFFGVMAVDLRRGDLSWTSPSDWSLQRMLSQSDSKKTAVAQWLNFYQNQHPQILFENSTVSTLSTDGQFVYVVEDLAVPPTPQTNINNNMGFVQPGMQNQTNLSGDLEGVIDRNKLFAISLAQNSGKLTWSLGTEAKDPLLDHYFLGPPLPLAGKLYLLADKQQEIRLICLETIETQGDDGTKKYVPRVVSTQTLGMTQEKMQNDPLRRTWAAHLAYGEGILVCPTNAGAVFGVNLLENSLVWAYPYRDKSDAPEPPAMNMNFRRGLPPGWQFGPDGQPRPIPTQHNQWKVTAPVISDGKVVFTAPDARYLHCINLRDGSLIWRRAKHEDDLYLGNVHNGKVLIVGKKNVRALGLSNGELLWTLETGTPSGQGIGSDNVYYLPLKNGGKEKEPRILGIDMENGKVVSQSKSRKRKTTDGREEWETPGNLLFHEGKVISVTADEIVVYQQLKVKIAEMDELIAKNPNDPNALTERGELRLDKGDLSGAIDDLSTALANNPKKEI
ncbi:MAG TPA: PQQ-binding-like beta-propeller repeat protein, partial [Gemmataceae bacterium]|nr:PQQ-binding-like beta-propeller repeat protein [Gemmataceae bacterium]